MLVVITAMLPPKTILTESAFERDRSNPFLQRMRETAAMSAREEDLFRGHGLDEFNEVPETRPVAERKDLVRPVQGFNIGFFVRRGFDYRTDFLSRISLMPFKPLSREHEDPASASFRLYTCSP
jgi:hypothetical protein